MDEIVAGRNGPQTPPAELAKLHLPKVTVTILTLYQAWMWLYLHILQLAPNFINNVDPVSTFWTLAMLVTSAQLWMHKNA